LGVAQHSVGVWSSGCRGNGASGSATQTWRPAAAPWRRCGAPRRRRRGLTSCLLWLAAQQEENPKGALGQGCGGKCPEVLDFPSTFSSLLLFPSCGEQGEISHGRRRKEGGACRWIYRRRRSRVWAPDEWRMRLLGRVAGIAGQQRCGFAGLQMNGGCSF
jgi:hypothetical protein